MPFLPSIKWLVFSKTQMLRLRRKLAWFLVLRIQHVVSRTNKNYNSRYIVVRRQSFAKTDVQYMVFTPSGKQQGNKSFNFSSFCSCFIFSWPTVNSTQNTLTQIQNFCSYFQVENNLSICGQTHSKSENLNFFVKLSVVIL